MGVKVSNNAFGTLSASINTSDTTITLDSSQGARFPTLGAGDYFYGTLVDTSNNLEIVKVTARSSDSMTVTRAQDNTTATAFAIGDRFELRPVAALFEAIVDGATVVSDTTPQLGGDLDTNGNDINFGDNDKAIFGAGSDLQIYHDSGDSYIAEGGSGTGSLKIKANNLLAYNNSDVPYFQGITGGTFRIYHNGSTKLATTSTGVDISGTIKSTRGIVQVVTNRTDTAASGNPVNTFSEINANYRVTITPQFSDSRLIGMFHIPMNPTGASNILMTISPWVSTNGGTTKTRIQQGNSSIAASRINQAVSFFRSNNGYDNNDMQNHVVMFTYEPSSTTAQTFGFFFRSEGNNTTYFNHSNGNNTSWGWVAPMNLIMQEVRT